MAVLFVHFVGGANSGESIHSEIDSIVDNAFNNILKQAEESSSPPSSANEHNSDGHHQNLHRREIQETANVEVTEQREHSMQPKGDAADDDLSWKQWKERHQKMDLHKESFHKTDGTSSRGISKETLHHSHHHPPNPRVHDSESVPGFGNPHDKVVAGLSTKSEDIQNKRPALVGAGSDAAEAQNIAVQGRASAGEEHGGSRDPSEETDNIPGSPAVETAASPDHVGHENYQNVRNEQLLKTEHSVKFMSFETAAAGVENENKDVSGGKETFHGDNDGKEEEVPELVEGLHNGDDGDEMQKAWRSEADSVDENTAADPEELEVANTENGETFNTEEHSDSLSGSNSVDEDLLHTVDEGISDTLPVNVDMMDSENTDIVPDGTSTGWVYSTLDAVYSSVDATITMVRYKASFCMCLFMQLCYKHSIAKSG